MPHLHRFFAPVDLAPGLEVALTAEEAHHALHVVRLRADDTIALINGRGAEAAASVSAVDRREVRVIVSTVETSPAPTRRLTLVQAALHQPKSMEFVVRHGTELGVDRFLFFRARHSEKAPGALDKLERVAIEAMKQSGRRWLPQLDAVDDLDAALAEAEGTLLLATLDTPPVPLSGALGDGHAALLIGPEGDFAPEETAAALATGAHPISLGEFTYRSEVCAIHAAALIQYHWGHLGP